LEARQVNDAEPDGFGFEFGADEAAVRVGAELGKFLF
jgi:hypothetical protein